MTLELRHNRTRATRLVSSQLVSMQPLAEHTLLLSPAIQNLLACPCCRAPLRARKFSLLCTGERCSMSFPVLNGVPILINESTSAFRIDAYREKPSDAQSRYLDVKKMAVRLLPSLSKNVAAHRNFQTLAALLLSAHPRPNVLVIGGAEVGAGMANLLREPRIELAETDICIGPRTRMVCDARDLPFADDSFDGVIVQAVLEYVADPERCVREIHRVLKPGALVYSEIPFMQQVHSPSDFTRFTSLGHRRLYRRFSQISAGATGGPGMALAWSIRHFLMSFAGPRWARDSIKVLTSCLFFWLKYFDFFLARTRAGLDAASGTFFLGQKSAQILPDSELSAFYQGALTKEGIL